MIDGVAHGTYDEHTVKHHNHQLVSPSNGINRSVPESGLTLEIKKFPSELSHHEGGREQGREAARKGSSEEGRQGGSEAVRQLFLMSQYKPY